MVIVVKTIDEQLLSLVIDLSFAFPFKNSLIIALVLLHLTFIQEMVLVQFLFVEIIITVVNLCILGGMVK